MNCCTHSGLQPVGPINWGDHFCHFYQSDTDVAETLIPYFKKGLESNEACLWVACDPYPADRALAELRTAVPDLDRRIASGQFSIFTHEDWYIRHTGMTADDVLRGWLERAAEAIRGGYEGLRLTGNTAWLSAAVWDDFMDYERAVSQAFRRERIVAMCSYSTNACNAEEVLDVVQSHDFALARRRGVWEMIENAATKHAKAELEVLNADLERRVEQRTADLQSSLSHQRLLLDELNHRVKNTLASVQTIVSQTLARCPDPVVARQRIEGRIGALARVHSLLSNDNWEGATLASLVGAELAPFDGRFELTGERFMLQPRAALNITMVLHELATNAAKYGALAAPGGKILISVRAEGKDLVLLWTERNGPAVSAPRRNGFGTSLIRLLVEHDLSGQVAMHFDEAGLQARLQIPMPGQVDRAV
jgi:two-component sensor histidine kinase